MATRRCLGLSPGRWTTAGRAFEDDRPGTLAEAMASLERGLAKWFAEQGVEVEGRG